MTQLNRRTTLHSELQAPPHNIEAEQSVLGSLLLDNKKVATVAQIIEPDDFYNEAHGFILSKILELYRKGVAVDIVTLGDSMTEEELQRIGGISYVASLYNNTPTSSHAEHYAKLIKKKSILRQLVLAGAEITELARNESAPTEETLSKAHSQILSVSNKIAQQERTDVAGVMAEYEKLQAEYAEKFEKGISLLGLSTGFPKVDAMIDGIRPSHLWVIGGYTNTGKTAFSLNILESLLNQGARASYYSLEMNNTDIIGRLLGIMTETSSMRIMKAGYGKPDDIKKIENAKEFLLTRDLLIHTTENELDQMLLAMKGDHIEKGVDVFFVDFLQLVMVRNAKSEYEMVTKVILGLQALAKELNVAIIALSQVNNEHAKFGKNSQVMGFKGSGGIAAAANFAVELVRADKPEDVEAKQAGGLCLNIDLLVKKNRHGAIGKINLAFDGESGKFLEGKEVRI